MSLKNLFKKNNKKLEFKPNPYLVQRYTDSSIDFNTKSLEEQKLLSAFYANNYEIINCIDENLRVSISSIKLRMTDIDLGIQTCRNVLDTFENAKKDYETMEGGSIYFHDIWESPKSDKGTSASEVEKVKKLLKTLEENYDEKKLEFQKNKGIMSEIESKLTKVISENPGIRQSEIYELFDPDYKRDIQLLLYHWAQAKHISRLRAVNTYRLYYTKKD